MQNVDYFEFIIKRPFHERLRDLVYAAESSIRCSIKACENGIGDDNRNYYRAESRGQTERVDFLFKNLITDYENRIENYKVTWVSVKIKNKEDMPDITEHLSMNGYTFDTNGDDVLFVDTEEISYVETILEDHNVEYERM